MVVKAPPVARRLQMLRQGGIDLQPLFALLFFCALGIFVGVVAHWADRASVWPWLLLYALLCALGALLGGAVLPAVLFAGARFLWRALLSAAVAVAVALVLWWLHRRNEA
ncbi:MAG TPA: hypothetical protein IAC36_00990 [Candidatus Aphodomonas merdavium]|nr:hypothetical protein [Candidatus Aphodomonas merdavium]